MALGGAAAQRASPPLLSASPKRTRLCRPGPRPAPPRRAQPERTLLRPRASALQFSAAAAPGPRTDSAPREKRLVKDLSDFLSRVFQWLGNWRHDLKVRGKQLRSIYDQLLGILLNQTKCGLHADVLIQNNFIILEHLCWLLTILNMVIYFHFLKEAFSLS